MCLRRARGIGLAAEELVGVVGVTQMSHGGATAAGGLTGALVLIAFPSVAHLLNPTQMNCLACAPHAWICASLHSCV